MLERQRDLGRVEARALFRELLRLAEVVEQLAARAVVQHEVQLVALEGGAAAGLTVWKANFNPTMKGWSMRPRTLRSVLVCSIWFFFLITDLFSTFIA